MKWEVIDKKLGTNYVYFILRLKQMLIHLIRLGFSELEEMYKKLIYYEEKKIYNHEFFNMVNKLLIFIVIIIKDAFITQC